MTHQLRITEAELVAACKREDRLAQKELYDRYKKAMYTLAYRTTGDFALAEDVIQEAFVKVFKSLKTFRAESTIGAWIKTIVIRTAYSKLRKKSIFTESLENQHLEQQVDWGHRKLDAEYLEKAILALPEGYRMVFTMVEIEGYAHKEVAEMLGISVGTSKSQLFYAKKKLRESLKAFGY